MIQVEWISGRPDAPFYQKAAQELAPVFRAMRLVSLIGNAEGALAIPLQVDAELFTAYRDYLFRESPWYESAFPRIHDTSVVRAENIRTLVAATLGAAGTGGTILSGPLAFEASIVFHEALERARLGLSLIGFGADDAVAAAAAAVALTPKPLGLDVLGRPLMEKSAARLAAGLLNADLLGFRAKVAELGREKDKAPLTKVVDEFIAQRGMYRGATTELRDRFNLRNDPGMARLKDVYLRAHGAQDPLALGFSAEFFADPAQFGGISTYNPREFPAPVGDDARYMFWLTEDRDARVPKFDKARKRQQAREKARAAADQLKPAVKQAQGDVAKLRDLALKNGDREFLELGPMARRMPVPSAVAGAPRQYQGPTIPQEKIAFAGADLIDGLLELRKEPIGSAAVLSDLPKDHFYVASLLARDEPTQDEFRRAYVGSMAGVAEPDRLLPELTFDQRLKYQRAMVKQLREQAKVKVHAPSGGETPPAVETEAPAD
jgi:hypothetical protein